MFVNLRNFKLTNYVYTFVYTNKITFKKYLWIQTVEIVFALGLWISVFLINSLIYNYMLLKSLLYCFLVVITFVVVQYFLLNKITVLKKYI